MLSNKTISLGLRAKQKPFAKIQGWLHILKKSLGMWNPHSCTLKTLVRSKLPCTHCPRIPAPLHVLRLVARQAALVPAVWRARRAAKGLERRRRWPWNKMSGGLKVGIDALKYNKDRASLGVAAQIRVRVPGPFIPTWFFSSHFYFDLLKEPQKICLYDLYTLLVMDFPLGK